MDFWGYWLPEDLVGGEALYKGLNTNACTHAHTHTHTCSVLTLGIECFCEYEISGRVGLLAKPSTVAVSVAA